MDENKVLDVESYIILRRETSALRPSFVLIELAAGIDLPDMVVEHPVVKSMEVAINDWVSWTNVSGLGLSTLLLVVNCS